MLWLLRVASDKNRLKKFEYFIEYFKPIKGMKILDVGASEREYRAAANILAKRYAYPEDITALGVEAYKEFCVRYPDVRAIRYDGGRFPFKDKEFDICWSNAVIEHVGDQPRQAFLYKRLIGLRRQHL